MSRLEDADDLLSVVPRLAGAGSLGSLAAWLAERDIGRAMVLTTPGRRHLERLVEALGAGVALEVFDGARVHVPRAVVDEARRAIEALRTPPEVLISLGGGSATGLGKILHRELGIPFVAIPTTYAGSEMTRIWGTTADGDKQTGRDDALRPDLVVHDPALFVDMPRALTVASLVNALAHPISALSNGGLDDTLRDVALAAVRVLFDAVLHLAWRPDDAGARERALEGAARAAAVLDRAQLGAHHAVAHVLGGAFDAPHAPLHAVLLPHSWRVLATTDPDTYSALCEAARDRDPAAQLFDALRRAGLPTSLRALEIPREPAYEAAAHKLEVDAAPAWVRDAWIGRRPSDEVGRLDVGMSEQASIHGAPLDRASVVVIAVHGRHQAADAILETARQIAGGDPSVTIVAPQAESSQWYEHGYRATASERPDGGAAVEAALTQLGRVVDMVTENVDPERVHLFGFSQGACLVLEWLAQTGHALASVVAVGGARLGPPESWKALASGLEGVPFLIGVAERDPWVSAEDVRTLAEQLALQDAVVEPYFSPGDQHEITARQRIRARELWLERDDRAGSPGFGNHHHSEQLAGAVPHRQNSPRHAAYGLYAEQISGSGFVADRHHNQRDWVYKIRPSSGHHVLEPLDHPTFTNDFVDEPSEVNLVGYRPLSIPENPTDFVDGIHTFGGAGDPRLRRGMAIHLYVANRSMEHRAFYDADGDLLIVPEMGGLTLQTELGVLDVLPGQIAIVPRGLLFAVHLHDEAARGFIGETYGKRFELPSRGQAGANGLADERHFRAPTAWAEDRLDPGYRRTVKSGGRLYETHQDHTPWDVVGWHGNYVPYVYDLQDFSPLTTGLFDHPDPSLGSVVSAPLDEAGANALDFVFFPERFDVSQDTFRPPFFHRNVVTEFNGIVEETRHGDSPFYDGVYFLTPSMTPHGVMARSVEHALRASDEAANRHVRMGRRSLWFQFESALPISLTRWAKGAVNRVPDWDGVWGRYRTYFDARNPDVLSRP